MTNSIYVVRNYQPADLDAYVQLVIEAEKIGPARSHTLPHVVREKLFRPNYCPKRDLFVVESKRNIVGYADVTAEINIGRIIIDCFVQSDHRRRGLATKLLSYAIHHGKELGAQVAHINISEDNKVAKIALSKLGFRFVRRFLQLRLEIVKIRWQDIERMAWQCRHLHRGDEVKLTQIQNRSFTGTWGYNPTSVEAVSYSINLADCCPEDVIIAYDGDRIIGYCWTRITSEMDEGEKKGQVLMLGVDPDYRDKGVGKEVLLTGLSYLKSKGIPVVELTVDSKNQAACALYQSVGFRIRKSSLWYEKAIG